MDGLSQKAADALVSGESERFSCFLGKPLKDRKLILRRQRTRRERGLPEEVGPTVC